MRCHSLRALCVIMVSLRLTTLLLCANGSDTGLTEEDLLKIRFDQKLGSRISLDTPFVDEQGNAVTLKKYFRQRPVILVLGYYECPMLCNLTMNGLVEGLLDLKTNVGAGFDVVAVSIDPRETRALAAAKRQNYLKRYGRLGTNGWHFLTGKTADIAKLTGEIGYHYAYDARIHQYAHPSGFVILTPDGKVSRYFFGVKYSAMEMDTALQEARTGATGSAVQQFILLCFHYSPFTGKYGKVVMAVVRGSGIVTMAILACLIVPSFRTRWVNRKGARP
jgi:protein SCO1/2